MEKKITRSFTYNNVTIKDGKSGEVLKEFTSSEKADKAKIAVKYIKESGKTDFFIDIVENVEVREMTVETFLANSTIVVPKEEGAAE
jgi:hypothetical protein